MDKETAEAFLHAQMKPVYGYCLRRCATLHDAEDLAQEILLRAYAALLRRRIPDPLRYLWTVARNTLANHYRERSRCTVGVAADMLDEADFTAALTACEETQRLHAELARLSRQQREIIVLHYFHGMKQADIAARLALPLGTVKWHLHEAKKELKQHMTTTREPAHLKFDPIRFSAFYNEGSIGSEGGPWRIFRSALVQNIAYACWREARTAGQIAEAMGVSPVYIEDAAAFLADQGYLTCESGRYRCAILLTEWTSELIRLWDEAHQQAAALIAPALAEALSPALLADERIGIPTGCDRAYAIWALVPWMIASFTDGDIAFDDVATFRPDGAHDLIQAAVTPPSVPQPALASRIEKVSGPCWNARDGLTLWQMDTSWSDKRISELFQVTESRIISLLHRLFVRHEQLTEEESSLLMQRGVLRLWNGPSGDRRATMQAVWLEGKAIREQLTSLARSAYAANRDALSALRAPLEAALLADTPAPLQPLRRYSLQGLFHSHQFIVHCLEHLVQTGLLPLPTEAERRSLHTIVLTD